jgi:hypothetical protein
MIADLSKSYKGAFPMQHRISRTSRQLQGQSGSRRNIVISKYVANFTMMACAKNHTSFKLAVVPCGHRTIKIFTQGEFATSWQYQLAWELD